MRVGGSGGVFTVVIKERAGKISILQETFLGNQKDTDFDLSVSPDNSKIVVGYNPGYGGDHYCQKAKAGSNTVLDRELFVFDVDTDSLIDKVAFGSGGIEDRASKAYFLNWNNDSEFVYKVDLVCPDKIVKTEQKTLKLPKKEVYSPPSCPGGICEYSDTDLNMRFKYPKSWTLKMNPTMKNDIKKNFQNSEISIEKDGNFVIINQSQFVAQRSPGAPIHCTQDIDFTKLDSGAIRLKSDGVYKYIQSPSLGYTSNNTLPHSSPAGSVFSDLFIDKTSQKYSLCLKDHVDSFKSLSYNNSVFKNLSIYGAFNRVKFVPNPDNELVETADKIVQNLCFDLSKCKDVDYTPEELGEKTTKFNIEESIRIEAGNAYKKRDIIWWQDDPLLGIKVKGKGHNKVNGDLADNQFAELKLIQGDNKDKNKYKAGKKVWIITHGYADQIDSPNNSLDFIDIAESIKKQEPDSVVLTLDWSVIAQGMPIPTTSYDLCAASEWIKPVANSVSKRLKEWGLEDGTKLNLVGHSLGSLVSIQISNNFDNKADQLIALEPPSNSRCDLNQGNTFQGKARITRSFVGRNSIAANQILADSADTKTTVEFSNGLDRVDFGEEHKWIYQVFNDINSDQKITNRGKFAQGYLSILDNNSHGDWSGTQVEHIGWNGTKWKENPANAKIYMDRGNGWGGKRGSVSHLTYYTNNGTELIKVKK